MGKEGAKKINLLTLEKDQPCAKKSVMPSNPLSFMAPSKLIRSANSPFQMWKNPNEKKIHDDPIDKGHNKQLQKFQLGIPNTCYSQATNNKINIMGKHNPDQAEKTIINDSLLTPDVGVEKSIMPFNPFSFMAPSKVVRSANSSFQVWKKPNDKKIHDDHDGQGNNNQQSKHKLSIPDTCYAQATNNKINIIGKPNPDQADSFFAPDVEKSIMPFKPFSFMAPSKLVRSACSSFQVWKKPNGKKIHEYHVEQGNNNQQLEHNIMGKPNSDQAENAFINDSLLTPNVGVEKSIMPFNPFSLVAPSKVVRSANSSFQVWKKPNDKKIHDDHDGQGNNNQQSKHKLSIPNTCYAQATNNKINIIGKPNPDLGDSLFAPDVEKSIMPFKPFSFMAPSKLVRSASSSFQVWKKPNGKKSHEYHVEQGNNNQQLEHNIMGKPNSDQAENAFINDSLLTYDVGVEKSIFPFKPIPFRAPSKLMRSETLSFQVWKNPNDKKSHDYHVDQGNNNQQLEHNIMGKPNPDQAEKAFINDNLLTSNVGVEKSIFPFKPFSFTAPSKLVRSASSSFKVWKNPNDKKSHDYHVDQGSNNQQLEHQLGIPNTCYAEATNNKITILGKRKLDEAEKTITNDNILIPDVGVEKSIMPFKPFSFMVPSKLARSASSSFQVWKNPNDKINHDYHVEQGNNSQQLEHQLAIPNTCYSQATNNKINILGKRNSDQTKKTIINDNLAAPDVGVSLINTNQNCKSQTIKSSWFGSNLDINKEDPKVLKRLVDRAYSKKYSLKKDEHITNLEKTTKTLRRKISKIRYEIKHNLALLIENHQLKSHIYALEMNRLHKEDEIAKNMEEVQRLKWLESNKQAENGVEASTLQGDTTN